jgi:Double zinc ribbon
MPSLAYFGIESKGLNLVVDLLIVFVVVLYLSLIYWTYNDARRRIADPMLVGCAFAASLFPFVGTIIYMILRPPEYLEDAHERELEMHAAEARLHELQQTLCPHCDYTIERDFVRCPSCLRKLKERCVSCQRPLDQAWTICPYCEAEVPGAIAPARRRPSRRSSVGEEPAARVAEDGSRGTGTLRERDSVAYETQPTEVDMPAIAASPDEEQMDRAQPVAAPEPPSSRSRAAPRAPRPRTSS